MTEKIDIAHLRQWIGKTETAVDIVTPRLAASLRATLSEDPGAPEAGDAVPLCTHWLLAPHIVALSQTGPDGHPKRGGFLPPVPLPRRMWAGGEVETHELLHVGDTVTRLSHIDNVELKEGNTGALCFVTVRHEYSTPHGLAILDRQDIVYREAPKPGASPASPPSALVGTHKKEMHAGPVTLFRYSALGFIGHRIHYDRRYCIEEEGYSGLVVHGPLQATFLMHFAAEIRGVAPKKFSYRGVSPMIDDEGCFVNARANGEGLELWSSTHSGKLCMTAKASW